MHCIYCRANSSNSRGVPHVFPEAFGKNDVVLPVGAVCDPCNQYLGHELDSVFASHPIISLLAQFLRLPGKNGKLRKRLGNVASNVQPRSITIPCAPREIVTHPDGSRSTTIKPLVDSSFDLQRFRRAIYHIGLNSFALQRGPATVLDPRFDAVRAYVRNPRKGESWPFAQFVNLSATFSRDVTILVDDVSGGVFVGMVLCAGAAFGVDLLNSAAFVPWVADHFPPSTEILDSDYTEPRSEHPRGPVQYRVTILLDD